MHQYYSHNFYEVLGLLFQSVSVLFQSVYCPVAWILEVQITEVQLTVYLFKIQVLVFCLTESYITFDGLKRMELITLQTNVYCQRSGHQLIYLDAENWQSLIWVGIWVCSDLQVNMVKIANLFLACNQLEQESNADV